ncbi:glycine betaine ABC transporter substrate-binding protein [Oleiagrimonas sp. MCCC 1A03011]|uniref:ABC transporter permease/substrate-binding protein n=1 Tax=Oleiagrimonas sp. MCCC 1A03011 TaxID=1926883 RepID=UPI000DC26E74|nr:glycine betaine ABC transporter substrate-binding protein [Oleiagrimonas sp. MCCC 1A03011]RAP57576.1 amino acid ABC transporter permease [Oleiagrimonas sp. MCCC 1A03011]
MMRRFIAAMGLALLAVGLARAANPQPVRIGSKAFTESVVLGEVARLSLREHGLSARHRRGLGGTRILWRALREGDIDAYPEYTGTLVQELLPGMPANAGIPALRKRLRGLGIGITDSLGFQDRYALGMSSARASALGIATISDLRAHPRLQFGFSNEFMDRDDGWKGLRRAYGLPQTQVRGMDHDLAYRALTRGAIDLTDVYTTDAEIPYYHLRVLRDDRHYFPPYQAVFLYRLDLARRAPGAIEVLRQLAGCIDVQAMQRMNAAVKLHGRSETQTAAAFLDLEAPVVSQGVAARIFQRTREHLVLVGISLGLALLLAVPLGVLAARWRRLGHAVMALTGVLQTVPSLAMFVFMIPLFGIGAGPAIAALFLYSLLPIVRNTHAGLVGIEPSLLESAAVMGLPARVRLLRIELPLALRSILAGVKIAAVINVGTATLGALIGAGGYGQPILTGIRLDDLGLILQGAVPAAVLALLVQGLFEGLERGLTPRGLRRVVPG